MTQDIPKNCIVADTESTGFDPATGDRLVEIGLVRMRDGLPTQDHWHSYIFPERSVPAEAEAVHGLSTKFLADKPLFDEIVDDFLSFIGDDPLVFHNAAFDAKFINAELQRAGYGTLPAGRFIDTIPIAKRKFPGQQVNLDALCRKLNISLEKRDKHGALIDAELLAEVCVELMGGRQANFISQLAQNTAQDAISPTTEVTAAIRLEATEQERAAHAALVRKLGEAAIWKQYGDFAA